MVSVTETTVERESDAEVETGGVSVDGEDEVVDYLQEVQVSEAAVDRWDADTAGTVTTAELVTDPDEELLDEAGLIDPQKTERADEAREIRDDLGDAVGAGEDWTASEKVIVIEVELPNGESFEEVYRAPVWDANSLLHDILDAADVVPGSGDSLTGAAVPVDRTADGWRVSPPTGDEESEEESDSISLPLGLSISRETLSHVTAYAGPVGGGLLIFELLSVEINPIVFTAGAVLWLVGMLWVER